MEFQSDYSRAPITEAILDIEVEAMETVVASSLSICQDTVQADYPTRRELKTTVAEIELGASGAKSLASRNLGFAFVSPDGKQLFQVRTNGFTANRLAPYIGWDTFSREARRLWNVYWKVARPVRVTRIALRYINRIDISFPMVDMKDYFRTSPEVAPGLPQLMAGFFMQVLLPLEDASAFVNIVQTIVKPVEPGSTSVILDLDLFRTADLPEADDALWGLFESLRDKKNTVFESCITDKTRELIR